MRFGATDEEVLSRLHGLMVDTLQRCTDLERTIAVAAASGFSTDAPDAALAASYNSLRMFRERVAELQQRIDRKASRA